MTNPPGEGGPTPPEQPEQPGSGQPPSEQPGSGQPPSEQSGPEQSGPEQPGYWEQQGQQQPYAYPPQYPPGYPAQAPIQYAPDHPKATTSLVIGILGVVLCQIIAPFAWSMGKKTLDEIDASQGRLGGRGAAQAGYVLGIVGTVLLALGVLLFAVYIIFMVALVGGGMATAG
jgi:hypothetical protein